MAAAAEFADLIQTVLLDLKPPDPEVFRLGLEGHSIARLPSVPVHTGRRPL